MIGYFRDPYPDELLYSICARLYEVAGSVSPSAILHQLFNLPRMRMHIEFPTRIRWFVNALPRGTDYTEDEFIYKHTLFPFYRAFLPVSRANELESNMKTGGSRLAIGKAGLLLAMAYTPRSLRFCPLCVKADHDMHGEPYWHRVHQLPGVLVCRAHQTFLEDSSVPTRGRTGTGQLITAARAIQLVKPRYLENRGATGEKLLQIAEDAEWILHARLDMSTVLLKQRYQAILIEQNPVPGKVRPNIEALQKRFEDYYPPDLQGFLGLDMNRPGGWTKFHRLWHGPHVRPPLHHLLMMQLLGYSAERFFSRPATFHPFGHGPWPCRNRFCPEFQSPAVATCQIARTSLGRFKGTFICRCGFSYQEYWPQNPSFNQRNGLVVEKYGHVWEQAFTKLWMDSSLGFRALGRELGVGTKIVARLAGRLGLPKVASRTPRHVSEALKSGRGHRGRSRRSLDLDKDRETVLRTIQENSKAGRKQLAQLIPTVYGRLWRKDRSWMENHLPPIVLNRRSTVEWQDRDQIVSLRIAGIIKRFTQPGRKVVWISRSLIARELGKDEIKACPERLPETTRLIEEHAESRVEFMIRRVRLACDELKDFRQIDARMICTAAKVSFRAFKRNPLLQRAMVEAMTGSQKSYLPERHGSISPHVEP